MTGSNWPQALSGYICKAIDCAINTQYTCRACRVAHAEGCAEVNFVAFDQIPEFIDEKRLNPSRFFDPPGREGRTINLNYRCTYRASIFDNRNVRQTEYIYIYVA